MAEVGIYGGPLNVDNTRRCGCRIRFRQGDGYDVYSCAVHNAGPRMLAALRGILADKGAEEATLDVAGKAIAGL